LKAYSSADRQNGIFAAVQNFFAGRSIKAAVSWAQKSKSRLAVVIALPVLLALFVALSFAADGYLPEDAQQDEAISVGAFAGGYEAIVAELAAKQASAETGTELQAVPAEDEIKFSLDSGGRCFFDTAQTLEITSDRPAQIYYTTNGATPDNVGGTLYTGPITLECVENVNVYNFSVIAYYEDGTTSNIHYRSYFVGRNATTKYDTLVFSLTSDPKNLTSRKTGIFNAQNIWNHGRAWERDVNVQCFTPDGKLLFEQNAGVRLFGAYSRTMSLKPMRLIARKVYDAQNRFEYDFFGNLYAMDGTKIETFQQLVLRNAGNDFGTAFMRDEVVHTLMAQQGFPFTEAVRPCIAYVNGELYGFYWIHEPYKDSFFEERYGSYNYQGAFVVLDGPERAKGTYDMDYDYLNPRADYRKMYAYSKEDLTDDAIYAELCARLDVESYLWMNASMAYVDNGDWPQNNNRAFKYFAAEGEDFSDIYGMDGKWYFIPHDTDWAFFADVNANTLERNYNKREIQYSPLFAALMQRPDCRRTFVTYMLDLMNGAFAPENAEKTVQSIIDSIRNSVNIMHAESRYSPAGSDNASFDRRAPRIIDYLKQRASVMRQHLSDKYNLGAHYKLTLSLPDGGAAYVNTLYVNGDFTGTYYENYTTILKPVIPPGKAFSCWLVNGTEYAAEELVIDSTMVHQAKVTVEMRLKDPAKPELSIAEVSVCGEGDYVILINNTTATVSTLGYSLTDDPAEPTKYLMPVMHIAPGETVIIYCKSRDSAQVLRSMVAGFALKDGETLTLSRKDPKTGDIIVLDSVKLPQLKEGNVFRRSLVTGVFFEVSPETEGTGGVEVNPLQK
jgi:hypothetical protein